MSYLGIDIGGSSVKMAAVDEGQTLWTGQSERYERPDTQRVIEAIRRAAGGRATRADGVGLCVPGLLDQAKRAITLSVNVPGLNGVNLEALIGMALGESLGRLRVVSDAIATGYDIGFQRQLRGRLLVLALGTGIGAAVLDDGQPLYVDGESPGHLGQMDVSIEGEPVIGPDGGAGSLEGYLGAAALIARYGNDLASAVKTFRGDEVPLRALARAIRIAHAIYRPDHVVLAGGLGIRLGHVLPRLRQIIETNLIHIAKPGWTLTVGDSDYHAALGAARMAR
ncbi:MAG TPA: ROK family protein [Tepidisphaeraceae bacterium]|nr:ROK family protein [Tepidisphaeraceae bacterium]